MKTYISNDLYKFSLLSSIKASKNGKFVAFLEHRANREENCYKTSVHFINRAENLEIKKIYSGEKLSLISVLDNGTTVVSETIKKDDKAVTNVYKIEVQKSADKAEQKELLFSSEELNPAYTIDEMICTEECSLFFSAKYRSKAPCDGENKDYYIFDELPFWENAKGVVNGLVSKIFVKNIAQPPKELSQDDARVHGLVSSPNSKYLAYKIKSHKTVDHMISSIEILDISNGNRKIIQDESLGYVHADSAFIDDNTLLFGAFDREFPGKNPLIFIYDIEGDELKQIEGADFDIGASIVMDIAYKKQSSICSHESLAYFTSTDHGSSRIYSADRLGNIVPISSKLESIMEFAIAGDEVFTIRAESIKISDYDLGSQDKSVQTYIPGLPEIYVQKLNKTSETPAEALDFYSETNSLGEKSQVSSFNSDTVAEHKAAPCYSFSFINRDGIKIDVYAIIPNIDDEEKIPVVLQIHGGPKSAYGTGFYHEMQVLASKGIASVFSNPRGSAGRGSAFANITGELGYMDYDDIIEAFDRALEVFTNLDAKRAGVSGGSYGGFMCNWIIGHTGRFKAACSQRSISSYISKPFTTDIGYYHNLKQLKATPWEDFDRVMMHSPLARAKNLSTPTLFIHSDEDYRCWQIEGISMYNALKMAGVPARICLFYGENHGLSRGGKPHNRIKRLDEIVSWFVKHLL